MSISPTPVASKLTPFPAGLFDLDVVFLIPHAWIFPVWVPLLGSLAAMTAAVFLGRPTSRPGV